MYWKVFNDYNAAAILVYVVITLQDSFIDACCRDLMFLPHLEDGYMLTNHVIKELAVQRVRDCRSQCFLHCDCQSYNIGPSSEPGKKLCQINKADKHIFPDDFKQVSGFLYHELQQNPCRTNSCAVSKTSSCQVVLGNNGYKCICKKGYRGDECNEDVDECNELQNTGCALNAQCINTEGSFYCQCPSDYIGDGVTKPCIYINECVLGNFSCPSGTTCSDLPHPESYECKCPVGFEYVGGKCEDVDECNESFCDTHAACSNFVGSYSCSCNVGFSGSGKRDECFGNGERNSPGRTCLEIKEKFNSSVDKVYYIDPNWGNHDDSYPIWCDMTTDNGGWTLVWSYIVQSYGTLTFKKPDNAVNPTPKGYSDQGASTSENPPLQYNRQGAMEYAKWSSIGNSFLIKSPINSWIACHIDRQHHGLITSKKDGEVPCKILKQYGGVLNGCTAVVPNYIKFDECGVSIMVKPSTGPIGIVYRLETCADKYWPIHDPCGKNSTTPIAAIGGSLNSVFIRK